MEVIKIMRNGKTEREDNIVVDRSLKIWRRRRRMKSPNILSHSTDMDRKQNLRKVEHQTDFTFINKMKQRSS